MILWLWNISNRPGRGGKGLRVIANGRMFGAEEWLARVAAMGGWAA